MSNINTYQKVFNKTLYSLGTAEAMHLALAITNKYLLLHIYPLNKKHLILFYYFQIQSITKKYITHIIIYY